MTAAAGRVAGGDYAARVPAVGMGTEFDDLAEAFNTMAADLGRIEVTCSQMLGDLAHEMRTPVATLGASLEAIAEGFKQADAPTLAMLRDQVARLSRLSEDIALVTTAKKGRLTMRRSLVAVVQVVGDATAQALGRYEAAGVDLVVRVGPTAEAALVEADADRVAPVLTNLLDNALRHTPSGGRVDLTVDRVGATVRIVVADDGEGIPAEHLAHVFDRFYRVDTARDRPRRVRGRPGDRQAHHRGPRRRDHRAERGARRAHGARPSPWCCPSQRRSSRRAQSCGP